jgi:hypothetical protein
MSDVVSHDGPPGAPAKKDLPEAFHELLEGLYYANLLFETKGDAGRDGIKTACHAVVRFIAVTHQSPLLAAPLVALRAAILDLEQGVSNPIIDLDGGHGSRSRSALKKQANAVAAVCLEVLVELGDSLDESAAMVARKAGRWWVMGDQEVTKHTVKNWRNALRGATVDERAAFELMRSNLLICENPRQEIERLLRDGPPGIPKT